MCNEKEHPKDARFNGSTTKFQDNLTLGNPHSSKAYNLYDGKYYNSVLVTPL